MTKIAIKSDRSTSFEVIFPIMEQFVSTYSDVIDTTLGLIMTLAAQKGPIKFR